MPTAPRKEPADKFTSEPLSCAFKKYEKDNFSYSRGIIIDSIVVLVLLHIVVAECSFNFTFSCFISNRTK